MILCNTPLTKSVQRKLERLLFPFRKQVLIFVHAPYQLAYIQSLLFVINRSATLIFKKGLSFLDKGEENTLFKTFPEFCHVCMYRNINTFCIDSSGYIYKCMEEMGNISRAIGNILNGIIPLYRLTQAAFSCDPYNDKACLDCNILPICNGGCPIDRLKMKMTKNVSPCSVYKNHIADLLPYMYNDCEAKKNENK